MNPRQTLLISGPSGGGKSTLIRQLADGSLAPEILSRLPADAGDWPLVEANNVLKGDASLDELLASPERRIVHYDIVFIHCYGVRRYEDDPAMDLLGGTGPLHVVFVRPDAATLRTQFLGRQDEHRKKKSRARRLWGYWVRRPLRRFLGVFTGKRRVMTADLYARNNWLAGCYRQWESFLHHLVLRHPGTEVMVVEPVAGPHGSEQFRLVAATEGSIEK